MKILDRYLVREMAGPFVFGVLAFVLLFVSANVLLELMELVTQLGLSLWSAGVLFVLRLPGFLVYTFPLATLVAILVAFGRLSGDSELVAMHAGGVSFRRLAAPLLIVGLAISVVTAALSEAVAPAANRRAEAIVREAAEQAGRVQERDVLLKDMAAGELARVIYAERLDVATGEMVRPTITWYREGRPTLVTVAERALWEGNDWKLIRGENYLLSLERPASQSFETSVMRFPTSPQQISQRARRPEEMTYWELREYIRYALEQQRETVKLEITLHQRFSIPFACFVFALIAPPLGMRSHRGSSAIGMGVAIMIGFGYYVLWHYLAAVAQRGYVSPFWAAWLPNVVGAAVGVALILRVRR